MKMEYMTLLEKYEEIAEDAEERGTKSGLKP